MNDLFIQLHRNQGLLEYAMFVLEREKSDREISFSKSFAISDFFLNTVLELCIQRDNAKYEHSRFKYAFLTQLAKSRGRNSLNFQPI